MDLDREWFETFFGILKICLLPALFAFLAFMGKAWSREGEPAFQVFPKGHDAIAAAIVRLANYVLLFAVLFSFLNPSYGRFSRAGAVWAPLFFMVLAGLAILLLVAGLYKKRNPELSYRAFVWVLLAILLFFVAFATAPVLL